MANTILFFGFILLALVIGTKLKINIGLVAAVFAFLLGTTAGGMSAGGVVSLFPTTLFFNFFAATFLFGFAGCNGTLKKFSAHCLYACRKAGWLLGLLFFLITVLIAALGASGSAPFFVSAICFSLAFQAGINPLLVSVAVWTGSMTGGSFPWTSSYATNIGQLEIYYSMEEASSYVTGYYIWRAVFFSSLYLVMFVALKGYRVRGDRLELERPEPFTVEQRRTLKIILGIIGIIVTTSVLKLLIPGKVTAAAAALCSFQMLAMAGIVINILWKTAPYEKVLKENVPWNTLLMLTLTGMYMALADEMGVIRFMSDILQNQIPSGWILPGIVAAMCILSFFVSGGVIMPMMLPLLSVFSAASAMPVSAIYCATQIGLTASSISPFSQGGAAALTGCSDEAIRKKLIKQQTILSGVYSVAVVIIAVCGGFSMLH